MNLKFIVPLVVFVIVLIGYLWVEVISRQEKPSEIQIQNPTATLRAFVSYNPGLSDIQERVVNSFVDGLVHAGWQVHLTTTSKRTPTDLADYDLLVIGTNTYWWSPDVPTKRYLKRLKLDGLATVILVTASGQGARALGRAEFFVNEAGGRVIEKQTLFVWRPNDESQLSKANKEVAEEIAYNLALNLSLSP